MPESKRSAPRPVLVHLLPSLAPKGSLQGGVAVAIDVLRATSTIVQALASGCTSVRPFATIDEAKSAAASLPMGSALLAGERGGIPIPGFDLGNSPREYTAKKCKGKTLVFTTTNGTLAILRAAEAERVLIASFLNFSAVCEQLRQDRRPVHIVCAGTDGEPTLEDTLLAGALVDILCDEEDVELNDSARLAWDSYENHGRILAGALEISKGGANLIEIGQADDLEACADIDKFAIVPELRRDPLRLEVGTFGIVKSRWRK